MVSKEEYAPFVSWSESGDSFIIWNQTEFAKILPEYFKTSNLTSFVRFVEERILMAKKKKQTNFEMITGNKMNLFIMRLIYFLF